MVRFREILHFASLLILCCYIQRVISASSGFRRHRPKLRTVDGTRVSQADYPYMVAVHIVKNELTPECGGAIVSTTAVATACHCVAKIHKHSVTVYPTEGSQVIAGTTDPFEFSEKRRVGTPKEFICHSSASEPESVVIYDAAVILLKKPWRFGPRIQPISMYSHDEYKLMDEFSNMFNSAKVCITPGWGRTTKPTRRSSGTGNFFVAKVRLLNPKICQRKYCPKFTTLCSLEKDSVHTACSQPEADAVPCYGDSGSPLICDGHLFGVLSSVYSCKKEQPLSYVNPATVLNVLIQYLDVDGSVRSADQSMLSSARFQEPKITLTIGIIVLRMGIYK